MTELVSDPVVTMGECQKDWQVRADRGSVTIDNTCDHQMAARSVRERMDHLYGNPDMSDLTITASDQNWGWGQTQQEFIVRLPDILEGDDKKIFF